MERADTHNSFAGTIVAYREAAGADGFLHAAKQVEEVADHPGFAFLLELLEGREKQIIDRLLPGGDSDELRTYEAHIRGLALASAFRQVRELAHTVAVKRAETLERERQQSAGADE